MPPYGQPGAPSSISSCPVLGVANAPQYPLQDKTSIHCGLQQDGCSVAPICPRMDERFRGISRSPRIAPKHDGRRRCTNVHEQSHEQHEPRPGRVLQAPQGWCPYCFSFCRGVSLSQSVGVSSVTGDGVAEFFQAVEASREEYEKSVPSFLLINLTYPTHCPGSIFPSWRASVPIEKPRCRSRKTTLPPGC